VDSCSGENVPWRLRFGEGVQPIDAGWVKATDLPRADFEQLVGRKLSEEITPTVSMQLIWPQAENARALAEYHTRDDIGLAKFIGEVKERVLQNGFSEEDAQHLVDILCIGVVAGRQEETLISIYAAQGLENSN